jgi:hypothetical protein
MNTNTRTTTSREWATTDVYVAAYVLCKGIALTRVALNSGTQCAFYFPSESAGLQDDYISAEVGVLQYVHQLNRLKRTIQQTLDAR